MAKLDKENNKVLLYGNVPSTVLAKLKENLIMSIWEIFSSDE